MGCQRCVLGGFGGAFIAIAGVYWTIKNSQKNTKETLRLSVLPVLVINRLHQYYSGNLFASMIAQLVERKTANESFNDIQENIMSYQERKIESLCFSIDEQKILLDIGLNQEQRERINSCGLKETSTGIALCALDYIYSPCYITNVGPGAAINTSFRLFKGNFKDDENYDKYSLPISIKTQTEFDLAFFVDLSHGVQGEYYLEMRYYDIHGEEYSQQHLIEITQNSFTIDCQLDQKHISKEDKSNG